MKPPKTLFALSILPIILIGCVFTSTYSNREEDKADAEKVTNKLFEYLKNKDYDAASTLFSKRFYAVTPKDSLKGMFAMIQNDLGDLQQGSLAHWSTKVVVGTERSSEYSMIYKDHHQKHDCLDSIRMVKEDDGKIRIIFFHVGY